MKGLTLITLPTIVPMTSTNREEQRKRQKGDISYRLTNISFINPIHHSRAAFSQYFNIAIKHHKTSSQTDTL